MNPLTAQLLDLLTCERPATLEETTQRGRKQAKIEQDASIKRDNICAFLSNVGRTIAEVADEFDMKPTTAHWYIRDLEKKSRVFGKSHPKRNCRVFFATEEK